MVPDLSNNGPRTEGKPVVFVDAGVMISFLKGDSVAAQLVAAHKAGELELAISPTVLLELMVQDHANEPAFQHILESLRFIESDIDKVKELARMLRGRERIPHPHDVLNVVSASECDYFVTRDDRLIALVLSNKPLLVTPEEFASQLRAA